MSKAQALLHILDSLKSGDIAQEASALAEIATPFVATSIHETVAARDLEKFRNALATLRVDHDYAPGEAVVVLDPTVPE
jgi:hypothetical protein